MHSSHLPIDFKNVWSIQTMYEQLVLVFLHSRKPSIDKRVIIIVLYLKQKVSTFSKYALFLSNKSMYLAKYQNENIVLGKKNILLYYKTSLKMWYVHCLADILFVTKPMYMYIVHAMCIVCIVALIRITT